jgi:hypothetical protein
MKTTFTRDEIYEFFINQKNQVVADDLLIKAMNRPEDDPNNPFDFVKSLNWMYNMGLQQGELQGRVDAMNEVMKFFEF